MNGEQPASVHALSFQLVVLYSPKAHSYYSWTKEFMEAGRERLTRDTVRDATQQEVQALKRENVELKQLVAELPLEGYRLKKTAIPILHAAAGING